MTVKAKRFESNIAPDMDKEEKTDVARRASTKSRRSRKRCGSKRKRELIQKESTGTRM